MTNLTNAIANITNTTKQEAINMQEFNKSALVSTMAAELYHTGLNVRVCLLASVAFIGAVDYMDDYEDFIEAFVDGLEITSIEVVDLVDQPEDELDGDEILAALIEANYLTEDDIGPRMSELCALRSEAYAPVLASEGITRRFGYTKVNHSPLFEEFIHALEATEYTVDDQMLSYALQVQGILGEDNDEEGYVIRGCQAMDSQAAYVSEFKGDTRGRGYQACCHGPNGQASDRSRALMNLVGVPTDYNIEAVKQVIKAEVCDMTSSPNKEIGEMMTYARKDPVGFIIKMLALGEDAPVSKPWSFVKATMIWVELCKGNRPYIGMAVGLDAKCSGPQLGALMVGDQQIAAACGFTLVELDDAYIRAIKELKAAGFIGITRTGIKKAYMGVFYGQGWAAFTDKEEIGKELSWALYGDQPVNDDVAKAFHKVLTASFGSKMVGVRQLFKAYAKVTEGRTKHFMPDGFEVAMNYKVKVNVLGEVMEYDTNKYDVRLRNNAESYKFINFQAKTLEVHEGDFARNGFVNMIQATDALIARLIVVDLRRRGAKHILSVHDCFRVNVTELHMLEEAIKVAYMELFGSEYNNATKDLPLGTDILGMYFEGANRQLVCDSEETMVSQFFSSGKRRMRKVNGVKMEELINSLGTSYYFAK